MCFVLFHNWMLFLACGPTELDVQAGCAGEAVPADDCRPGPRAQARERACGAVEAPRDPRVLSLASLPTASILLQGNIVCLVHDSGDTEDEESDVLLNGLSHQSHLILRAEGLATGFCKDVHGQVRGALAQRELLASSVRPIAHGTVSGLGVVN